MSDEIDDVPDASVVNAVHRIVAYAVKQGRLIRASTCAWCGGGGPIEGHHPDYARPLMVVWLCRGCHQAHHRQYGLEHRQRRHLKKQAEERRLKKAR